MQERVLRKIHQGRWETQEHHRTLAHQDTGIALAQMVRVVAEGVR